MLYAEFSKKAKELVLSQTEEGMWYLEPDWVDMMHHNNLGDLEEVSDSYITDWLDVEDMLKLEVEKRNLIADKKKVVIDWLYDIITTQVEPAMLAEETDYIKNVVEFMKVNHEVNDNIVPFPNDNEIS